MDGISKAIFCAREDNDLISALRQSGYSPNLAEDLTDALRRAEKGGAILALADGYPSRGVRLTEGELAKARASGVRLYVEYPESLPGEVTGEPRTILYERLIAPDGFFGSLESGAIMTINGCWHRPRKGTGTGLLCLGKAAGYDTLRYGLPDGCVSVLDWLDGKRDALVATTSLSSFIRGRFAPADRWRAIWETILGLLGADGVRLRWKKDVDTRRGPDEPLEEGDARRAWRGNVAWAHDYMVGRIDTSTVVYEGYGSAMDYRGRQFLRSVCRGDCMGETAMELAYGWKLTGNPELKRLTGEIADRVLTPGAYYHDDPDSPMYGLNNWYEHGEIFYGDDAARLLLGLISARSLLGDSRWDEKLLRCAAANLRTSDRNGLRRPSLTASSFADKDWTDYYYEQTDYVSPHYQAYLWAAFLWIYSLTGIEEFLAKSRRAISIVMERFPHELKWQNSLTGEISRMLLPLSFLMRVDPTQEHRAWLERAVDEMLLYQRPCGAIQDAFGDLSLGKYPPPRSNESYGTTESSLIQQNGDPATDLLYTTNWAFIGLWEASLVIDEPRVARAWQRLRDFLIRIQCVSEKHPELNGVWMRGFDYEKWEYWGTTADVGWSAWCVESGWVNAWIATTLMLAEEGKSLMDSSASADFSAVAPDIYREMLTPRKPRGES